MEGNGLTRKLNLWFFKGIGDAADRAPEPKEQEVWWKVMCLTGVDYFSSLGYAPGIAFVAAGVLSPFATLVLVLLNLLGALPIYCKVAERSPYGLGSLSMLERLLAGWRGKALVLCLLGFAATDFVITMTLSAADAAAHIVQNPWMSQGLNNRMLLTLGMLGVLGAVFLKGFREAIGLSVILVFTYLILNLVVVATGLSLIAHEPSKVFDWLSRLTHSCGSPWHMAAVSILLFPKLALGMSGFETGVAVMPHIRGDASDTAEQPLGRIRRTKYLLATAACIMGFFLLTSSLVTAILIPAQEFQPGGLADGRALAYLAHLHLGPEFGTLYDISTITILWFAGASAMTGLLNLVPRYLPRYGMAPHWAAAQRPLILFIILVAFVVTVSFRADVDAQGGAYATGVLVLMTSAALASTLAVWKHGLFARVSFSLITVVFVYTTLANCIERPEGIHIATFFIAAIVFISIVSRVVRSTELRVKDVSLDERAQQFIADTSKGVIHIVGHTPTQTDDYCQSEQEARELHSIEDGDILFLEVRIRDASAFSVERLEVTGVEEINHRILRCDSPATPNAMAALLLVIRDRTGRVPNLYLTWSEGNPVVYTFRYLIFGEGETAFLTREILRSAEPDRSRRPRVHVA